MDEIWKDVVGYEGLYMVSSLGRVKSCDRYVRNRSGMALKRGKMIAPAKIGKTPYLKVSLWKDNKQETIGIHRIVASTFLKRTAGQTQVNHKDEKPWNNCVDNLEWCTPKYNVNYGTGRQRAALRRTGVSVGGQPIGQYSPEGDLIKEFSSAVEAAAYIGGDNSAICRCANGVYKTSYGCVWRWL